MRGHAVHPWPGPVRRMSGSAAADADGGVNKVRVKRQIRGIVKDLENILGDLKDVAKELKEVRVTAMMMRRRMRMKLSCVRFDVMFICPSRPDVNMTFIITNLQGSFTWVRIKESTPSDARSRVIDSCHSLVYCCCCFHWVQKWTSNQILYIMQDKFGYTIYKTDYFLLLLLLNL